MIFASFDGSVSLIVAYCRQANVGLMTDLTEASALDTGRNAVMVIFSFGLMEMVRLGSWESWRENHINDGERKPRDF